MIVTSFRNPTSTFAVLQALTVAVVLLLASAASAQVPGADQYTPTAPSGAGPTPATSSGSLEAESVEETPVPESPADSGSEAAPSAETDPAAAPATEPSTSSDDEAASAASKEREPKRNGDQRTLDGIAAATAGGLTEDQDRAAAARVLRDDGGDSGLGIFFFLALGAIVLWAILTPVLRRRREGDQGSGGHVGSRSAA